MTARQFLVYGLLAGFIAGLVAFGVAHTLGEPAVDASIGVEEATAAHEAAASGHAMEEEPPVVSRANQSTWGLLTGTLSIGVAVGGLIGLASALAMGRFGRTGPQGTTALAGALGFGSAALLPWLIMPPNPPAVGSPDTLDRRTWWFFGVMFTCVVATGIATWLARRLRHQWGAFWAGTCGVALVVVVAVLLGTFGPRFREAPAGFPVQVLWDFRLSSLATQAALWATATLVIAALVTRTFRRSAQPVERQDAALAEA